MSDSSILIVHPDRKTQRVVQRILGATGYRVNIADDVEQGIRLIGHHAPALVVVDGSVVLSDRAEAFFDAAEARGTEACMTLLGNTNADDIPKILMRGAVTNLLVHQMPTLAEELTITAHKLLRRDLFGLEKYLLWGVDPRVAELTKGSDRAVLVEQVANDLRTAGQSPRVSSMAMLVTDELLSNAVHNAPVDADGHHFRRDLARDQEVMLQPGETVRLRWACDARYVAIEVNDSFGSLDRKTILHALGKNDVRESGGGAGMGLALTYRSCDHLVFNLSPGRKTEIIALIDVRQSPTDRLPASSYNVFVER
ncbi:MAG: response regulator [Kofleriaceae bacterium]|nr:response regulator [Kofleriaceae bacterium]